MADITTTLVGCGSDAVVRLVQMGGTANVGDVVYLDTSDSNKFKIADANGGTALQAGSAGRGVLLTTSQADGDYGVILTKGTLKVSGNSTLSEGDTYVLSETAGGIAPDADVTTSGAYKTLIGVQSTTTAQASAFDDIVVETVYSGQQV